MKLIHSTDAQMNTIEGLAAALLMIFAILFVSKSAAITMPQSGQFINSQLQLYGHDALIMLDQEDSNSSSQLKKYIAGWDGIEAGAQIPVSPSLEKLDHDLSKIMPDNVLYNVDLLYAYDGSVIEKPVIYHGIPPDNSIIVFQLVTLYDKYSNMSNGLEIYKNNTIPDTDHDESLLYNIVQVRCTLWYA
ncbi:MAG: hypothetical protein C5S46_06295 [Candidatus Methanomarinus sp.]|uniref:Uncharacterized protein n=1 Tax=Candidatus Methanomarinus sp. TaxID=3386244 RepID=A0AC61S9I7_9EURY|nr:MAG: hypothetical protein C5S46_06295 [ANME-2 cluster archaeon]